MSKSELPEAYRIGWVPFIHTEIHLDSRPLIPRTETEYWVNEVIKEMLALNRADLHVLDLCAGSGCIGIAVLKDVPGSRVDFAELDETQHTNILENVGMNGIDKSRAQVFGGDLFEHIHGTYDFILTNPPYIDASLDRVEESVISHEPALALYGGTGGLEVIDRILVEAESHLNPGGELWLEHEPEQVTHISKHPSYQGSYNDQYGILRYSHFINRRA